jgi:hypothetical protein
VSDRGKADFRERYLGEVRRIPYFPDVG